MCAHIFPHAHLVSGGRVRYLCLNRAAKSKDLSSDSWACPHDRHLTKELWPKGFTPKTRHLTKDLGAYSPREIHMRRPMSAREAQHLCSHFGSML